MPENRYDDFASPMTESEFQSKINGAFSKTQGVGHNHKQKAAGAMNEGNGGPIELEAIDPTLAGGATSGTLWQIISWITRQLNAITGNSGWWNPPTKSIAQIMNNFESDGTTAKQATTAIGVSFANRFPLSAFAHTGSFPAQQLLTIAQIDITLQNNVSLKLKTLKYRLDSSSLKINIIINGGTVWSSSTGGGGDIDPNAVLKTNTTGSTQTYNLQIEIYNTNSVGVYATSGLGGIFEFSKE